jgi:hypothetical protein
MHNISIVQALSLWTDLELALAGKNTYGGDTAEIYMYRLSERNPILAAYLRQPTPTGGITEEVALSLIDASNTSLYNLLTHFSTTRHAAITVEGRKLGAWLKKDRNTHRVHVTVRPKRR